MQNSEKQRHSTETLTTRNAASIPRRLFVTSAVAMLIVGCRKDNQATNNSSTRNEINPTPEAVSKFTEIEDPNFSDNIPPHSDAEDFLRDVDPATVKIYEELKMEGNSIRFYGIIPEDLIKAGLMELDENNQVVRLGYFDNNNSRYNSIYRVSKRQYPSKSDTNKTEIIITFAHKLEEEENRVTGGHIIYDEQGEEIGSGGHG